MAAWLPQPVMFDSSRTFDCMGFTAEQCQFYKHKWHNWYVADLTFALPTVAFFMCTIGVFVVSYTCSQILAMSGVSRPTILRKAIAACRIPSYRGLRLRKLNWNLASIGVLALGAVGMIFFLCMTLVPSPYYWPGPSSVWGNSSPLGTRSGWLALACMPFLFATATKTSWITFVTGVSHEKLQVFHRWIAYAFFFLALMHTFPFIVWHIRNHDMVYQFNVSNIFEYWTGVVALLLQAWLTFASAGPIRNLGYEFFKAAHFLVAVLFMVIFFWHCDGTLTSWHYFVATAAVYVPCWTYPWLRTLFEYGIGQKANVYIEDNDFIRITIPANFRWTPGQHCFLRFRSFGLHAFTSHPFTICSLPSMAATKPSELVFYVRRHGGFTSRLYNRALQQPSVQVPVLVDGPYGGADNAEFFNSDRVVIIAGGSGAGWMLGFVEQFLRYRSHINEQIKGNNDEKRALNAGPQSMRIILATRDIASRTWFSRTLESILLAHETSSTIANLEIDIHLTSNAAKPTPTNPVSDLERSGSSSASDRDITEKPVLHSTNTTNTKSTLLINEPLGRPDLPSIIAHEAAPTLTGSAISVFACGPASMQNDVRNAVAHQNMRILKSKTPGEMYLHLEHFSWA